MRKLNIHHWTGKYSIFLFFLFLSIFTSKTIAEPNLQNTQLNIESRYVFGVKSIIDSHQYLQKNNALVYWHLSPFYISQLTGSSCSLASATMVMNAILSYQKQPANEPHVTQDDLLNRVNNNQWRS